MALRINLGNIPNGAMTKLAKNVDIFMQVKAHWMLSALRKCARMPVASLQPITTHNILPSLCQLGPLVANNFTGWRCNWKISQRMGEGRIFIKPLRFTLSRKTYRMIPLSARSISLESTFKSNVHSVDIKNFKLSPDSCRQKFCATKQNVFVHCAMTSKIFR
jgi:hypothetical protein